MHRRPAAIGRGDINYGGGTLVLTAPSSGCSWSVSNLDTYGWNDRASSFKSFAGCTTALWQDINFGGSHIGYSTNVSAFGSFNDQASSWRTLSRSPVSRLITLSYASSR